MMVASQCKTLFETIVAHDTANVHGEIAPLDSASQACLQSGQCQLSHDEIGRARFDLPIFRGDSVVSIVTLVTRPMLDDESMTPTVSSTAAGALEIWQPRGEYADLGLSDGFYGKLERFQNVSSFVQFESGRGLPGQVWQTGRSVIHDDLANHPGFLRSAGASAESLNMAMGLPIGDETPVAAVVLLASLQSPLADGLEIWSIQDGRFVLRESRYVDDVELSLRHDAGQFVSLQTGLPGLALQHGGATTSSNPAILAPAGDYSTGWRSGIAIPIFIDGEPVEVVTMLLRGS